MRGRSSRAPGWLLGDLPDADEVRGLFDAGAGPRLHELPKRRAFRLLVNTAPFEVEEVKAHFPLAGFHSPLGRSDLREEDRAWEVPHQPASFRLELRLVLWLGL